ncbi:MAG: hypothetical protein AB8B73_09125 [Ekhidna sp.]
MPNQFSERFKNKTDDELTSMVSTPKKHVPEAVEAAIEELNLRANGISEYIDPINVFEDQKIRSKPNFRFIKSFFRLIIKPDTHLIQTSIKNRLLLTIRFYFLTLLFLLVSSTPMMILEELGILTNPKQFDAIPDFIKNSSDIFIASILISIIAGFLEETQFRVVLHKYNKRYFDIFIALFLSYLITKLFGRYFLAYTEFYSNLLIQSTLIYLIFAVPIYLSLSLTNAHSSWFENNWNKAYKYLFYGLALLFAVAHLPTLDLTIEHLIFFPLTILPFLVYALIFSYVRIRIGFQYAVILHFTIDLIIIMAENYH